MCSRANRLHLPVRAGIQAQRAADQLHRWAPVAQRGYTRSVRSLRPDVNIGHRKMKKIRLFMLTRSVMRDNSTVAHPKSCRAAVFPYLTVKALAPHGLRWATAHADWTQSPNLGKSVLEYSSCLQFWSLFLLPSAVAFRFLPQTWTSVTPTRAKGRAAASTPTVPTLVTVSVATARWSRRTEGSVKVSHSKWHDFRQTSQTALCFLPGHLKILSVNTIQ